MTNSDDRISNPLRNAGRPQDESTAQANHGQRGDSHFLIYATFASADAAEAVGRALVVDGLARCVNVLPHMTSIYSWQGMLETAREAVLIAKVTRDRTEACVARIKALHDYDLPAILVIPVVGGFAPYLDWLATRDDAPSV